jgi:hypothetical protein
MLTVLSRRLRFSHAQPPSNPLSGYEGIVWAIQSIDQLLCYCRLFDAVATQLHTHMHDHRMRFGYVARVDMSRRVLASVVLEDTR